MKKPQTGIVIAAPKAEAIMLEMNFDRSIGGIHTAVIGWIAGHEAEDENKKKHIFCTNSDCNKIPLNYLQAWNLKELSRRPLRSSPYWLRKVWAEYKR